jgi:hypothetical protein
VGGCAEVEVVGEDNIVIGERELYVAFVDGEDVAQLGSLQFLQQGEHAWSDLLEQMGRRGQHLEDCLGAY